MEQAARALGNKHVPKVALDENTGGINGIRSTQNTLNPEIHLN